MQTPGALAILFTGVAIAGINWKMVWLEPQAPVLLTVGASQPYTVMGRSGADTNADLTRSEHLEIVSSDPNVIAVDRAAGRFVGVRPGHAHVQLSFSEAKAIFPAFIRQRNAAAGSGIDGVWKAVFTGDPGARPKMVSEIFFDLKAERNALTGTVHAAYWPGDAPVADGRIDRDRVSFTMVGRSPFQANGVTGYPKLCFTGVRRDGGMKVDLLWTEARSSCADGRPYPMFATRLAN